MSGKRHPWLKFEDIFKRKMFCQLHLCDESSAQPKGRVLIITRREMLCACRLGVLTGGLLEPRLPLKFLFWVNESDSSTPPSTQVGTE
jgi:hypothetical protein